MILLSDMEEGIERLIAGLGMFFNQGQVCTSASRLLIEKSIYDRTLARLAEIADGMSLGAGLDAEARSTRWSPSTAKRRGLCRARAGGRRRTGQRRRPCRPGAISWRRPSWTMSDPTEIMREEMFGPVVAAMPWRPGRSDRIANDTRYGLSASIWTRDMARR